MNGNCVCGCFDKLEAHNHRQYNDIKEMISIQYLASICSFLGASFIQHTRALDKDGLDGLIESSAFNLPGMVETNPKIVVQMKSTSTPKYSKDGSVLKLSVSMKEYERMMRPRTTPLMLAVLVLPQEVPEWVHVEEDYLRIAKKMYWIYPITTEDEPKGDGQEGITLNIPTKNIMNEVTLYNQLKELAMGVRPV